MNLSTAHCGRALAIACLALIALACRAQAAVSAQLTDGTGSVASTGYLHFELENCGNNFPAVASGNGSSQNPWTIVQTAFDMHPTQSDGSILGQVLGNDQILCGNVASTYYQVTAMKDAATPLAPVGGQPFVICTSSAPPTMPCSNPLGVSWNPALQQPSFQPVAPGFVQMFQNPLGSQEIDQPAGTKLNFVGEMNFCSATLDCVSEGPGGIPNPFLATIPLQSNYPQVAPVLGTIPDQYGAYVVPPGFDQWGSLQTPQGDQPYFNSNGAGGPLEPFAMQNFANTLTNINTFEKQVNVLSSSNSCVANGTAVVGLQSACWPGDIGAQINAACASNAAGTPIVIPAGAYTLSTPVVFATFCPLVGTAGLTVITSTLTSGVAITDNSGSNHVPHPLMRGITLIGPGAGTSTTGVSVGSGTLEDQASIEDSKISGFGTGITHNNSFNNTILKTVVIGNGVGVSYPIPAENVRIAFSNIAQNVTGILIGASNTTTLNSFATSYDDNSTVAVSISGNSNFSSCGDHFENAGGGMAQYITVTGSNARLRFCPGTEMWDDVTTGTNAQMITFGGDQIGGDLAVFSRGRTTTQVVNGTTSFCTAQLNIWNQSGSVFSNGITGSCSRVVYLQHNNGVSVNTALFQNYNLKPTSLTSLSANPAASGFTRLASSDTINWRNNANSGDIGLGKNTSDQLTFNGVVQTQTIGSGTATSAGTLIGAGTAQTLAITVSGALTTDVATCATNAAYPATWQTGISVMPPVVTANTVTLTFVNPTAGSITPATQTFRCTVVR
jgi:hypothetical protein